MQPQLFFSIPASAHLAASSRSIVGLRGSSNFMTPADLRICDLSEASKDRTEAALALVVPEMQRRMGRAEGLVKKAPYTGGGLLCEVIEEARRQAAEIEDAVAVRQKTKGDLPKELVEALAERIEKVRDDCIQVLRDADLM